MEVDGYKKHASVRKRSAEEHIQEFDEQHHQEHVVSLPPLTVDQLAAFRKKRGGLLVPPDNLCLPQGSFGHLKTEYTRRFKCYDKYLPDITIYTRRRLPGEDPFVISVDEQPRTYQTEYEEAYKRVLGRLCMTELSGTEHEDGDDDLRPVPGELVRKCTGLRLEGDFSHITCYAEDFIRYLLADRRQLQRRDTSLRLVGDMDHRTENRNSFVPYENVTRPPLCKKFTNLHLSGSFHADTENRENFVPFKIERQHPLAKLPTSLHLEGTLYLEPEYKSAFVQYQNYEKPKLIVPVEHIKSPVEFSDDSDPNAWMKHPLIPDLRTYEPSDEGSRWGSRAPSRSSSRPTSRAASRPPSRSTSRPPSRSSSRPASRVSSRSPSGRKRQETDEFSEKNTPDTEQRTTTLQIPTRHQRPPKPEKMVKDQRRKVREHEVRYFTKTLAPNMASRIPNNLLAAEESVLDVNKNVKTTKWHPVPFRDDMRLNRRSKEPGYLEGGFECQPEYRRAYMNYLVRERLENKPHLIKRSVSLHKNLNTTSDDTSDTGTTTSQQRKSQGKPPINKTILKNLDKMETCAFGPKCRKLSTTGTASSDDTSTMFPKKSFIPRPVTLPLKVKTTMDTTSDDSVSEPAFVII
ncbi:uncharacterized protein LOC143203844 [Rhynchophorus ferrugineus]|uniref:uncharacterized protein LOC143203844 n=1 Tax=Rhynchophorus ferrugineus TaxID=354439 RepID=UPI003FCCDE88